LLALTAALRARPEGTDAAAAKFLGSSDPRIRADAANTLSRVRAKNANEVLRKIAANDTDENARVNAMRALGAAEDKAAFDLLLNAATTDKSPAIRIAAIRSLAQINEKRSVGGLIQHGRILMAAYPKSLLPNPLEKNELLEIASALGRINAGSSHKETTMFLAEFQDWDSFQSPEVEIALARVSPELYDEIPTKFVTGSVGEPNSGTLLADWRAIGGKANGWREIANSKSEAVRDAGEKWLQGMLKGSHFDMSRTLYSSYSYSIPDALRAYASYAPADLNEALLANLNATDVSIRATAAELLAERPPSKENIDALKAAFTKSLVTDKDYNDAQLAILDALVKLNKKESVGTLLLAIEAADYLLRKRAFEILDEKDLHKEFPGIQPSLENAWANRKDQVLPYSPKSGTRLGQILNTDADYRRAAGRKNGSVRAIFTTQKGSFTIEFLPEGAPLTVDNFVKLARSGYFNGLEVHRVVPNFVMQDGDPRGDGNGGPGWSIRCEVNMVPYERGAVGMALSGKDTGGSQWFVTHLPQPHLDGGYTVFGKVNEAGMKVVDRIVRGDKIVNVKIVEGRAAPARRR
jgi:cyclophilin family peptidyl-prolyl cis-trans isomerase